MKTKKSWIVVLQGGSITTTRRVRAETGSEACTLAEERVKGFTAIRFSGPLN